MKVINEKNLKDFEFWSGAKDRAQYLTEEEFDTIEQTLEECYPDGMTETEINDFFWFDFETVAEWIGTTEEEIFNRA